MVTAKHIMRGNGVAGISVRVGFRCFRDVAKAARKLPVRETEQSYTKVITVSPRPRFFLLYTRNTIEREGTKWPTRLDLRSSSAGIHGFDSHPSHSHRRVKSLLQLKIP